MPPSLHRYLGRLGAPPLGGAADLVLALQLTPDQLADVRAGALEGWRTCEDAPPLEPMLHLACHVLTCAAAQAEPLAEPLAPHGSGVWHFAA